MSKATLLIVDDAPTNILLLTMLLEETYTIKTAASGSEALEMARTAPAPDLILLDVEMPQLSGYEVCQTLKANPQTSDIPVIFVTAKSESEDEAYGLSLGAVDYISKPFVPAIVEIRIKNQIELKRNKALLVQYKEVVDRSAIVSKTDAKGIVTYVNGSFCEISGYTQAELLGRPHNVVRHPDTPKEIFKAMWHRIQAEKKVWQGVIQNRKKDGAPYWVKTIISPILDNRGDVIEYIGIRTDITEQELLKAHFKEQYNVTNHKFQAALKLTQAYEHAISQSNVLSRTDTKGRILYINETFEKLSGYSKAEAIGKTHRIVRHEDTPDTVFKSLWETITSGQTWKGIIKNRAKNGDPYWVNTTVTPIRDEEDTIIEYLAIRHDLTDLFLLHEEIESTQREIVYKMGEIGESRSQETGNHVKRVAEYSRLFAKLYGLGDTEAEVLFTASPMHDIGKVGIPDSVLKKPGPLDVEEWRIMQTHAQIGYDILQGSKRPVLQAAAIVAGTHHEKWDGSGYPKGLSGEAIPIFGRITALADVFDALGSDRCYKKAWKLEDILNLFEAERGKHFDPALVDLFFDHLEHFIAIRERFKD